MIAILPTSAYWHRRRRRDRCHSGGVAPKTGCCRASSLETRSPELGFGKLPVKADHQFFFLRLAQMQIISSFKKLLAKEFEKHRQFEIGNISFEFTPSDVKWFVSFENFAKEFLATHISLPCRE
ncbi:MAG: hypothetical protein AAF468_06330 [Pseudomonadota bacterium]